MLPSKKKNKGILKTIGISDIWTITIPKAKIEHAMKTLDSRAEIRAFWWEFCSLNNRNFSGGMMMEHAGNLSFKALGKAIHEEVSCWRHFFMKLPEGAPWKLAGCCWLPCTEGAQSWHHRSWQFRSYTCCRNQTRGTTEPVSRPFPPAVFSQRSLLVGGKEKLFKGLSSIFPDQAIKSEFGAERQ